MHCYNWDIQSEIHFNETGVNGMFKKSWINKLNGIMDNGFNVSGITPETITINNGTETVNIHIEIMDNVNGNGVLCVSKNNGIRNYRFENVSRETMDFKTVKNYIDNMFYDINNGFFNMGVMI